MRVAAITQYVTMLAIFMIFWQFVDGKFVAKSMQYNTLPQPVHRNINPDKSVARKSCRLKRDVGPCRASIPMYYFDPQNGECFQFSWGGCQGNGNRFRTERQCLSTCLKNVTETSRPQWCSLSFDYGFCFGAIQRYYYDHLWKVCKETIYSGCGGNRNNFYSLEQCESICRFGKGKLESPPKSKGRARTVLIINPRAPTTKKRQTPTTAVVGHVGG